MKRIDVAIGIVVRAGRVLICQRKSADPFGGYWEFPGGKCEIGEPPAQCVARELHEELTLEARPVRSLEILEHDYPALHVRLHPFLCEVVGGEAQPVGCARVEWIDPLRLIDYRFPEANGPLIRSVIELLSPAAG